MKNDFDAVMDNFLKRNSNEIDYEFVRSWVGKSDGLVTVDGVTLSVFDRPWTRFVLRIWFGDYFLNFADTTLSGAVNKALLHLIRVKETAFASGYDEPVKAELKPMVGARITFYESVTEQSKAAV